MNANAQFARTRVKNNERQFAVYRDTSDRSYDGTTEKVGEVAVWAYNADSTSSLVVEGIDEDTSIEGLMRPSADLTGGLSVADELRLVDDPSRRYEVRGKVGVLTPLDPLLYQLALDRANAADNA